MTIKVNAIEKVLLFGDSLMAGYGLSKEQHLSVILENSLRIDGHKINIINGSVSGSTSSGGLNRAEWTLSDSKIDLMILCLGANDMLRGIDPKETKNNLTEIINIAASKNIKIILAGMIAPKSYGLKYKNFFDKIFKDLSNQFDLQLVPFLLEGVVGKTEFNLSDGMHPNDKGTIIISNTLKKAILENL